MTSSEKVVILRKMREIVEDLERRRQIRGSRHLYGLCYAYGKATGNIIGASQGYQLLVAIGIEVPVFGCSEYAFPTDKTGDLQRLALIDQAISKLTTE